eukprot:2989840-Pyramimonas_sp.AAC.1
MGQGPPLGNLVTDAVIRRLDADSWARDYARTDRPMCCGTCVVVAAMPVVGVVALVLPAVPVGPATPLGPVRPVGPATPLGPARPVVLL